MVEIHRAKAGLYGQAATPLPESKGRVFLAVPASPERGENAENA